MKLRRLRLLLLLLRTINDLQVLHVAALEDNEREYVVRRRELLFGDANPALGAETLD
jgi:hypothetical protein